MREELHNKAASDVSDFLEHTQVNEHFFDIFQHIHLFFNSHLQCGNVLRRYHNHRGAPCATCRVNLYRILFFNKNTASSMPTKIFKNTSMVILVVYVAVRHISCIVYL